MSRILFYIAITASLLLAGCAKRGGQSDGREVPSRFLHVASFGQQPEQVLQGFYGIGFKDAASGERDNHFDTIPAADGTEATLLKIIVPPDTAGFTYLGLRWQNVQLQLDGQGLYAVTYHSPWGSAEVTGQHYVQLLQALEAKGYRMMRTVVGTSTQNGEATNIQGHRYTCGQGLMQCYINQDPDGTQSISLNFTQSKAE